MQRATEWIFELPGWNLDRAIRPRFLLAVLSLCLAPLSSAQIDRAGLSGTVTDPSGRVLPHTRVTAVQVATTLQRTAISSAAGTYDIPELPVGNYKITFEHEGFKSLTFVDVEEVVGRTRTLNATLQVSGKEERVEVSASSAEIDKTSDALGGRIEQEQAKRVAAQRTQLGDAHCTGAWRGRYGR